MRCHALDRWHFHLVDRADSPCAHGCADVALDESAWRVVQVPHDWMVEHSPSLTSSSLLELMDSSSKKASEKRSKGKSRIDMPSTDSLADINPDANVGISSKAAR